MSTLPQFSRVFDSTYTPRVFEALKHDLKNAGSRALGMDNGNSLHVRSKAAGPAAKEENLRVVSCLVEKIRLGLNRDLPSNFLWNLSGKMFTDVNRGKYLTGKRAAQVLDDTLKTYNKSKAVESRLNSIKNGVGCFSVADVLEKYGSKSLFRSFPREFYSNQDIVERVKGAIRGAGHGNPTSFPTKALKKGINRILGELHCSAMNDKVVKHCKTRGNLTDAQAKVLAKVLKEHSSSLINRLGQRHKAVNPDKLFKSFKRLSAETFAKFYTDSRDALVNTVRTPKARKGVENALIGLKRDGNYTLKDEEWDAISEAAVKEITDRLIAKGYTSEQGPSAAQLFSDKRPLTVKELPGKDWVLSQLLDVVRQWD